jgi:hypothetical protein
MWQRNLARQRIEQHAHIPYTHGFRSVYDEFTTAIHQILGKQISDGQKFGRIVARRVSWGRHAARRPQVLIRIR